MGSERLSEQYGMYGTGAVYDTTPSQMSNLDTVEQGIVAGPLGESGPRKTKKKKMKEDLDGTGGTEAAAVQAYGESQPKNTVSTIKRVLRDKYRKRLI